MAASSASTAAPDAPDAPDPAPAPAPQHPDPSDSKYDAAAAAAAAWARFELQVQALIPAVVGLAAMFTGRHLPCPLRALAGSLGQMPALAGGGFDGVTLRCVKLCVCACMWLG